MRFYDRASGSVICIHRYLSSQIADLLAEREFCVFIDHPIYTALTFYTSPCSDHSRLFRCALGYLPGGRAKTLTIGRPPCGRLLLSGF